MKTVHLTVNGEPCSAHVAGRTQLAELLRDHLHLTGTHLGCEHGVCGACTVLVDGKPIRSCITWAQACEGANVVTVEGLGDDPTGRALGEAFARHHALQCGFCTSGMLVTAWDIVTRLAPTSEAEIRRELSGNLCRCTGYVGIVAAVQDVARRRRGETRDSADAGAAGDVAPSCEGRATAGTTVAGRAEPAVPPASLSAGPTGEAHATHGDPGKSAAPSGLSFAPFEVDPAHMGVADSTVDGSTATGAAHGMTQADGWSRIEREFVIGHPLEALWALFEDLPRVAGCLPGVHVESAGADRFAGTWSHRDWDAQRKILLDRHDDLGRDEVGLMLIVVTGRYPILDDVDLPNVVTPRFRRWLDELDALPITAPEWRDSGEFARAVDALRKATTPAQTDRVVPLCAHQVNHRVQVLADALDIQGVSTHSGRRGLAFEGLRRGASTEAVQAAGGWRSASMVHRYARGRS